MSKEVLNNNKDVQGSRTENRASGSLKAHLSVAGLYLHSIIYKLLVALLAMAAIETALFYWRGLRQTSFDEAVSASWLIVVFFAAFLAAAVICMSAGASKNQSKVAYTFRRLRISERAAYLWHFACCIITMLLLWAAQAAVLYGLSKLWASAPRDLPAAASVFGSQGIYLAYFRNNFLHAIVPLQDGIKLAADIVQILSIGAACSYLQIKSRQPKGEQRVFAPVIVFSIAPTLFRLGFGEGGVILTVLTFILGGYCLAAGWNLAEDGRTHTEPEEFRPLIGKEARDA